MSKVVNRFLEDKEDGLIGRGGVLPEDERLLRYPITYVVNQVLKEGYLQDVHEEKDSTHYQLIMIILSKDKTKIDTVRMNCISPDPNLEIDWDSLFCVNRMFLEEDSKDKITGEKF
jgi:hypothetical protein